MIFFVENMREAFAMQSFSHFSNKKYWHVWDINVWNFNKKLTKDVVSFEQLGPAYLGGITALLN